MRHGNGVKVEAGFKMGKNANYSPLPILNLDRHHFFIAPFSYQFFIVDQAVPYIVFQAILPALK